MYEYISGTVADLAPTYAVIDAGGVGYYMNISLQTFSAIERRGFTSTSSYARIRRRCTVSPRR